MKSVYIHKKIVTSFINVVQELDFYVNSGWSVVGMLNCGNEVLIYFQKEVK